MRVLHQKRDGPLLGVDGGGWKIQEDFISSWVNDVGCFEICHLLGLCGRCC